MKTRRILLLACAISWLSASPAAAQTADELVSSGHVIIRARVEPESVLVGQKAELVVDVLTRTWFLQAPRFPGTLGVEDAIVLPPSAFGINFTDRIGSRTYAGQTRKFTIFATSPGRFEIPPVTVMLVVADESARPTPELQLETPVVAFEARTPAQTRGLGLVVASPGVTVAETWSRTLDGLEVGDSISRTVTMTVESSPAMLLPALEFTASEGVAVYPGRPSAEDQRNRGQMKGTRIERVTYVLEQEGPASLPEIVIRWWDLEASELREEVLPAATFEVASSPTLSAEHLGTPEEEVDSTESGGAGAARRPWLAAVLAALAAAVFWALRRAFPRWGTWYEARRRRKAESETSYFREFTRAARSGRSGPAFGHLMAWVDRVEGGPAPTVGGFVRRHGERDLIDQVGRLEAEVFGVAPVGTQWSPSKLVRGAGKARRRALRTRRRVPAGTRRGLGSINPTG